MAHHHTCNVSKIDTSQTPALDIDNMDAQPHHPVSDPTEIRQIPIHTPATLTGVGATQTDRPASGELPSDPVTQCSPVELELGCDMSPMPTSLHPQSPVLSGILNLGNNEFEQNVYSFMEWSIVNQKATSMAIFELQNIMHDVNKALTEIGTAFAPEGPVLETIHKLTNETRYTNGHISGLINEVDRKITGITLKINDTKASTPPPLPPCPDHPSALLAPTAAHPIQSIPLPQPLPQQPPTMGIATPPPKPISQLAIAEVDTLLSQPGLSKNRKKNLTQHRNTLIYFLPPQMQEWVANAPNYLPEIKQTDDPFTPEAWTEVDQVVSNLNQAKPTPTNKPDEWTMVVKRNASSDKRNMAFSTPTAPPRRQPVNDTQLWILCFGDTPPDPDQCLTDTKMWALVNSIDKERFPFEAKSVTWSNRGNGSNVMIRFSALDKYENIDTQSHHIRRWLAHGHLLKTITFTKNVRCSKLVIANVPCRDEDNMDQVISIDKIEDELKKNPHFKCLSLVQRPRWTSSNLENKTYGSVSFIFEGPDGSSADEITS